MEHRERVEAAFRHRVPDRTPIFEYVLHPPVASDIVGTDFIDYTDDSLGWIERAKAVGWHEELERYVNDRLDLALKLDHDMLYACPCPTPRILEQREIARKEQHTEMLDGDPVQRVVDRNAAAKSRGVAIDEDSLMVYHLLNSKMERRGLDLPMLAPAYAHGVWTDSDLMQTMALAPDVAFEHFAIATEESLARIDEYINLGVTLLGVGGDFAGKRPMVSPTMYGNFIVPEIRKCSRAIHEAGCWAVNASDGDLWSVIDEFLLGCDVDGYLEIDMFAGMDLSRLKTRFGDKITFLGNMDCGNVLSFNSPEEIARITVEIIEAGSGNGGHIFCSSNAITKSVPTANYMAMVNAFRRYFELPEIAISR
ncbi:MAG: hypothetical protein HN368_10890 [Spirochaetales bacterium]|nr:hypothetical protein [Spirochaetales bacterium]